MKPLVDRGPTREGVLGQTPTFGAALSNMEKIAPEREANRRPSSGVNSNERNASGELQSAIMAAGFVPAIVSSLYSCEAAPRQLNKIGVARSRPDAKKSESGG
ncbi:MAG: hypothetical protein KGL35_28400, partial [Bradyrhizobium sp.]|nr:hypothetical protein [Bradyrhizobium sp.]